MQGEGRMVYIQKNAEPKEIAAWKKKFKNINNRRPRYEDLKGTREKECLKEALIGEQKQICCYCCNRISNKNSHIEHFRPKGTRDYKELSLEYTNLHASCQGDHGDGRHCGHAKGKCFEESLMISPLDEYCSSRFAFKVNGEIYAADDKDEGAVYTIRTLALNDNRLKRAREEAMWVSEALMPKTEEERAQLIQTYRHPADGAYAPFLDAILYQLEKG